VKIAFVSEGTYPFALGGVSTWCDQLIRGMPGYRWEMVALTVDGSEQPIWPLPPNLDAVRSIPLWGSCPSRQHGRSPRRRRVSPEEEACLSSYGALLRAMLAQHSLRSDGAAIEHSRFLLALHGMHEYASAGGDLCRLLTGNAGLELLVTAWRETHKTSLSLAEALQAADLIAHMLRPLAWPPVECDVVHSSMNGLSMLVAMTAKWRYGTPIVMSEHGVYLRERYLEQVDPASFPGQVHEVMLAFHRTLAATGCLIADALAPHSRYNSRWQLVIGSDPDRIWTMYNGVAPEQYPVAEQEPDRPTIVFMGRINPLKDIHTLIRAFHSVRAEVPDALLRIFGSTPAADIGYQQSCRRLIEELGLGDSVVLEGNVETPVTAYHAATIVALTSISEGFPVVILEAMACGRPIVCTNVGGVAEAVADAGIVVAPRDPRAVARACVTLLADDELRSRMAKAARARVLELFTLDRSIAAYEQVYESVIRALDPSNPAVVASDTPALAVRLEATTEGPPAEVPAVGASSRRPTGAPVLRGRLASTNVDVSAEEAS
jgi:glycosyltransferase involved in cell wall biosynthesis